jgi:hypothetical protein
MSLMILERSPQTVVAYIANTYGDLRNEVLPWWAIRGR